MGAVVDRETLKRAESDWQTGFRILSHGLKARTVALNLSFPNLSL
jgi:hypothetical protein